MMFGMQRKRRTATTAAALALGVTLLVTGCGTAAPTSSAPGATTAATPAPSFGPARLEVPETLFGMNLDWGTDTAAGVSERTGSK